MEKDGAERAGEKKREQRRRGCSMDIHLRKMLQRRDKRDAPDADGTDQEADESDHWQDEKYGHCDDGYRSAGGDWIRDLRIVAC
jgi:hypothetical protein